jgi:Ca2+-binding RTX toxin-like protein
MRRSPIALALVLGLALPASASAATLTVSGGTPSELTYQAAPGELNDVAVSDLFDERGAGLTVSDAGAAFTVDPACDAGPPLQCPHRPIAVHLGDRSDRASVISHFVDASVWGDDGSDEILSSGFNSVANGGAGNDRLRVNAADDAAAFGGGGSDRIDAASGFLARAFGESGNDLIVHGPSIRAILDGGPGSDVIVGLPEAFSTLEAHGGTGADVLAVQPTGGNGRITGWTLSGDDGDDLIAGGPGADTVDGGRGRDAIYTAGGDADTVSCGSGYDTVRADASDTVAADCEVRSIAPTSSVPSDVTSALRRAR